MAWVLALLALTPAVAEKWLATSVGGDVIKAAGNVTLGGQVGSYASLLQARNPSLGEMAAITECCGEAAPLAEFIAKQVNGKAFSDLQAEIKKQYIGDLHCSEPSKKEIKKEGKFECQYVYTFKNKLFSDLSNSAFCVPDDVCSVDVVGMTKGTKIGYSVVLQILNKHAGDLVHAAHGDIGSCLQAMNEVNLGQHEKHLKKVKKYVKLGSLKIPTGETTKYEFDGMKEQGIASMLGTCANSPSTGMLYVFKNKFWDSDSGKIDIVRFNEKMAKEEQEEKEQEELAALKKKIADIETQQEELEQGIAPKETAPSPAPVVDEELEELEKLLNATEDLRQEEQTNESAAEPAVLPAAQPAAVLPAAQPALPAALSPVLPAAQPAAEPAAPPVLPAALSAVLPTAEPAAEPAAPPALPAALSAVLPTAEPAAEPAAPPALPAALSAVLPTAQPAAEPAATPALPAALSAVLPTAQPAAEPAAPPELPAALSAVLPTAQPAAEPAVQPALPAALTAVLPAAQSTTLPEALLAILPKTQPAETTLPAALLAILPTTQPAAQTSADSVAETAAAEPFLAPAAEPAAEAAAEPSAEAAAESAEEAAKAAAAEPFLEPAEEQATDSTEESATDREATEAAPWQQSDFEPLPSAEEAFPWQTGSQDSADTAPLYT
ncbi:unnamed protein product [Effrenium voratum]|uniref:Circumsporozoite protein n=1 Tax=Effrenium voratum TaxID=2562239 RepID=A0AA36MXH5_9DINO|nr:unnamed protein product [Effrenium voratum]CAJ1445264.1 unnamed protein product [Effrenium voratum]